MLLAHLEAAFKNSEDTVVTYARVVKVASKDDYVRFKRRKDEKVRILVVTVLRDEITRGLKVKVHVFKFTSDGSEVHIRETWKLKQFTKVEVSSVNIKQSGAGKSKELTLVVDGTTHHYVCDEFEELSRFVGCLTLLTRLVGRRSVFFIFSQNPEVVIV